MESDKFNFKNTSLPEGYVIINPFAPIVNSFSTGLGRNSNIEKWIFMFMRREYTHSYNYFKEFYRPV